MYEERQKLQNDTLCLQGDFNAWTPPALRSYKPAAGKPELAYLVLNLFKMN